MKKVRKAWSKKALKYSEDGGKEVGEE